MALIDQRILIPAPIHTVWAVLSDIQQLPRWRVDCQQVAILTPRQFGAGTHWQVTPPHGKPYVEEVTAWYEAIGYEYRRAESRAYRTWFSRIRMQATPEGTIVQWTINYLPKGLWNRLMDAFGRSAQYEEDCEDSLRELRRLVEMAGVATATEAKRRTLQPVAAIVKSSTQPISVPLEVFAADTQPKRPEGLDQAHANYARPDTPPQTPTVAANEPVAVSTPPPPTEKLPPGMPEILKVTPPQGIPRVDVSRLRYADELDDPETPPERETPITPRQPTPILPPPTHVRDTGEVSIWEAFGLTPPSTLDAEALQEIVKRETGQHRIVALPDADAGDTRTFSPLFNTQSLRVRQVEAERRVRRTRLLRVRKLKRKDKG